MTASSPVAIISTFVRILRAHRERDSSTGGELRGHDCLARRACSHEIVQNAVRDRFIEGTLMPIGSKIKFERFAFDTEPIGYVIDIDPGKIRLARDRTNGSEVIRFKMNPVIPARRIWESLKARVCRRCG